MKRISIMPTLLLLGLLLVACSSSPSPVATEEATSAAPPPVTTGAAVPSEATSPTNEVAPTDLPAESGSAETRVDEQGTVIVSVTPLNLSSPGTTLDFEVILETHSVDLSMDLAALATLTNDNGRTVKPTSWDGPQGGHHVAGTLSFPTEANGELLLADASGLTLTINNVDAPERVFTWELP